MSILDPPIADGTVLGRDAVPSTAPPPSTLGRSGRGGLPRAVRRAAGPLLLVVAWQVLSSTGMLDSHTLAAPLDALRAGRELAASGELQTHLWVSLKRVTVGLGIGLTVGLVLAIIAGLFKLGEDLVDSTMQVLRSVPVLALTPLLILWLGIEEQPKIAMVAIGATFPIYLNTYAAIRGVDSKLVETASTFGVTRYGLIRHVILPGALPGFLVGLRYSLSL